MTTMMTMAKRTSRASHYLKRERVQVGQHLDADRAAERVEAECGEH